jgi:OmpA-OmpF porin, OOP family
VLTLSSGLLAQEKEAEGWDFVPGEKVLLFDDFTDMPRGAAPPHWKARGGALKLVDGRLTSANQEVNLTPNITKWPHNFTIEMDIQSKPFEEPSTPDQNLEWSFNTGENWVWHASLTVDATAGCSLLVEIASPAENQQASCKWKNGQSNQYSLWVQDGRLRFYFNGERLIDMNQVKADFETARLRLSGRLPVSFGAFRFAESAPDVSKTLFASGRYVTHGIQFDVNSDALRSESKPVLQQIADALTSQPTVKVRIEGHTDSSGDAAKNLDLSKRRAAAVKDALAKQFGIAADRVTTDGFGDTKPAAGNDTPQGRAENRRVEFVKL